MPSKGSAEQATREAYQVFLSEIGEGDHMCHLIAVIFANGSTQIMNELAELGLEERNVT